MDFFRWNAHGLTTYTLVITPSSTNTLSAGGGTVSFSATLIKYKDKLEQKRTIVSATYSGSAFGFSINGNTVTAADRNTTVGNLRSISITGSYNIDGKTITSNSVVIKQEANVKTPSNISFNLSDYSRVDASGGTANPTYSYLYQNFSYTSGHTSTENFAITEGQWTVSASSGGVSVDNKGVITYTNNTSTTNRTSTINVLFNRNGISNSFSVSCSQSAGVKVYEDPVCTDFHYDIRSAAGGTLTPYVTITQVWTWNGVANSGNTLSYTSNKSGTNGPYLWYSLVGDYDTTQVTLDANTGIVTWKPNTHTIERSQTVKCRYSWNSKDEYFYITAEAKQNADSIDHYGEITITKFDVQDIPASGGTVSQATRYSAQMPIYYVSGDITYITSGFNISYSTPVVAPSKGTVVSGRTEVGTLILTASLHGKSISKSATVYQNANNQTYISCEFEHSCPDSSWVSDINACPASQCYVYIRTKKNYSYTSGDTNYEYVRPPLTSIHCYPQTPSEPWMFPYSDQGDTYFDGVKMSSWGIKEQSAVDFHFTLTLNNKDCYITGHRVGNSIDHYGNVTFRLTDAFPNGTYTIPAAGGCIKTDYYKVPGNGWFATQRLTYTSGEYKEIKEGEITISFKESQICAGSLHTTITPKTFLGRLEFTVKGYGGKTTDGGIDVYQAENKVEHYSSWDIGISYDTTSVPATGGSRTILCSAKRDRTYSSTDYDSETGTPVLSVPSTAGVTLSNGVLTFTNNTTLNTRSVVVTATIGSDSKSVTIYQSAGYYSYGDIVVEEFSYPEVPATGGSASPVISYYQTYGWNGNTTNIGKISSGATLQFLIVESNNVVKNGYVSIDYTNGVVTWTNVSGRYHLPVTLRISRNDKSVEAVAESWKKGNEFTYSDPVVSAVVPDVSAGGGEPKNVEITFTQTYGINGNTSGEGIITDGGYKYWNTDVNGKNLKTATTPRTKIGTLTAYVTSHEKTGSTTVDVYQEENKIEITEDSENVSLISQGTIPEIIPVEGGAYEITRFWERDIINIYTSGWQNNIVHFIYPDEVSMNDTDGSASLLQPHNGNILMSVKFNPLQEYREVHVTIRNIENNLEKTLSFRQAGN